MLGFLSLPRLIMFGVLGLLAFNLWNTAINPAGMQYEASQASLLISKLFADGLPMYEMPGQASASPYSLLYGPMMFLPGSLLYALGFGTAAQQALASFGWVALVVLILFVLPRRPERWILAGWLLWPVFVSLIFFAPRADPLWVLLPALGALLIKRGWHLFWVIGLAAIAANIKIHSVLYFLPMLPVYLWRRGISLTEMLLVPVLFGAAFLLPFAIPGVDLSSYVHWLTLSGLHELDFNQVTHNSLAFIAISLPVIALMDWGRIIKTMHWTVPASLGLLLMTALAVSVPASKIGASAYHFLPFIGPAALILCVTPLHPRSATLLRVMGVTSLAVLLVFGSYRAYIRHQIGTETQETFQQFDQVARDLGGYDRVAIAPGNIESRSRVLTMYSIERGSPFVVNDVQLWDYRASGLMLPGEFYARLSRCDVPHFVVGHNEPPFGGKSLYTNDTLIPGAEEVFRKHYSLSKQAGNIDVWSCNTDLVARHDQP